MAMLDETCCRSTCAGMHACACVKSPVKLMPAARGSLCQNLKKHGGSSLCSPLASSRCTSRESVRVRVTGSGPTKGMPVLSTARQRGRAAGWALSRRERHYARS
eukprot:365418-Chlamydomonas_euryale.AAC.4